MMQKANSGLEDINETKGGRADIGKYGKPILFAIREAEGPVSKDDIIETIGENKGDISETIEEMIARGILERNKVKGRIQPEICDNLTGFSFLDNNISVIADSIWLGESYKGERCICMDCNDGEYITNSTAEDIERFIEVLQHYLKLLEIRKRTGL